MITNRLKTQLGRLPKEDKIEALKALMISTPDLLNHLAESNEKAVEKWTSVNEMGGYQTSEHTLNTWSGVASGIRGIIRIYFPGSVE